MQTCCFHCGEKIPDGFNVAVTINNVAQPMCCYGCEAVASTIVNNHLTEYYRYRSGPANKQMPLVPDELQREKLLDEQSLQNEFTFSGEGYKEAILTIEGINCAACAWLIEKQLSSIDGLLKCNVNATTQRAFIQWNEEQLKLSTVVGAINAIGYQALPFKANDIEKNNALTSKAFIKRLGVCGILMMQVMMIAVGLYFGAFSDMAEHNLNYLRGVSLLLTIPIVTYGALPFYLGAVNALKALRLTMDVPISLAIVLAFSASAFATLSQQGEIYFESVSMFTFLLVIGKFLEFRARAHAAEVSSNLLKLMPLTATRFNHNVEEFIAAKNLQCTDRVLVKPGETIPADGIIVSGSSQINEAMLSGEQHPVSKTLGATVFAGTVNGDGNLQIEVTKISTQSFLSQLIRLSETSFAHKPKIAQLSDQIAQYFVGIILLTAVATAIYWSIHLPEQAFWITLSVLVATCPCALSLATPTALTCATTRLNRDGILIKSAHVMETIPKLDCFAFDKTGTLTTGVFAIERTQLLAEHRYDLTQVLNIAAALETYSEHPLAKAFTGYRNFQLNARDVTVHSGLGITGIIAMKGEAICCQIGKPGWLLPEPLQGVYQESACVLMANNTPIAAFYLSDQIRPDAQQVIAQLEHNQIATLMLSGDNESRCRAVASTLKMPDYFHNLSAEHKLAIIQKQQQHQTIAFVGDGVNDTPVFGAAHVAIAMGSGTDIAKNGADVILLSNKLSSVLTLQTVAQKTRKIIIENYLWAFGYNALILPLAVTGYITPYLAVIGMSASSLLVISNSLRLLKK